jgi:Asp-tRNA(Asn)/Glu-tRNA(Gln) amidotransferase A subunit family amidase
MAYDFKNRQIANAIKAADISELEILSKYLAKINNTNKMRKNNIILNFILKMFREN